MEDTGKNVNGKGDTAANTGCEKWKPEAGECMSKYEAGGAGKGPELRDRSKKPSGDSTISVFLAFSFLIILPWTIFMN